MDVSSKAVVCLASTLTLDGDVVHSNVPALLPSASLSVHWEAGQTMEAPWRSQKVPEA